MDFQPRDIHLPYPECPFLLKQKELYKKRWQHQFEHIIAPEMVGVITDRIVSLNVREKRFSCVSTSKQKR